MARGAVLASPAAGAHPGGLAADGCHNDRKNGGRHCHSGGRSSPPASPRRTLLYNPADSGGAYRNGAEARAAGAAPVRRGDPQYGRHLDRDNHGIGCG
ncbi:excalibur calcium-binding domain-containing protein [Brevundimonas sp.]|uniref:excalibur calcium-binding domain-containing protein n=1 Tax=Brevundimonas sp. TaxID=1871086 RepID=UPI0035B49930